MINIEAVKKLALSFEEVEELPHFEKTSFRIRKKIFAALDIKNKRICLKLSEIDQSTFTAFDKTIVYPVSNKWGKQGWTYIELKKAPEEMLKDMLTLSYCRIAPKKLADKYRTNTED